MSLAKIIQRNKKIHFILKGLKHINNERYLDYFLNRETNPLLLEFESFGKEHPEKKFYLINETGKGYGFFAEMRVLLGELEFAEEFGFIPVVSWGTDFLYHCGKSVHGKNNAYEYFFEQPAGYSTNDTSKARLVTTAKSVQGMWIEKNRQDEDKSTPGNEMDISDVNLKEYGRIYQKYIHLIDTIKRRIDSEMSDLLKEKKTLAVHYRGTDFKMNYDNHPVCVTIEQEFEVIDRAVSEYGIEQIFLATDETEAVNLFLKRYGEKVVFYKDVFRGNTQVSVAYSESDRENHKYTLAYEVLRDVYTLAACNGLVGGVSQVTIFARIVKASKGSCYDFTEIINNGKNYNNNKYHGK